MTYEYDEANRLTKVIDYAGRETLYFYDDNDRLIITARPNGTGEVIEYNEAGQIVNKTDGTGYYHGRYNYFHFTDTDISVSYYEYDPNGNVSQDYTYPSYFVYNDYYYYDNLERVIERHNRYSGEDFAYDPGGNMTFKNGAELDYGTGNRLEEYDGHMLSYDSDGNMTQGPLYGNLVDFEYDQLNPLVNADGRPYTYDGEGTRITNGAITYVTEGPNGRSTYQYIIGNGVERRGVASPSYLAWRKDRGEFAERPSEAYRLPTSVVFDSQLTPFPPLNRAAPSSLVW